MNETLSESAVPRSRPVLFFKWLLSSIPTAVVLAALAGLGYWGHHTGWHVPKLSGLAGNGQQEKDDWCEAHGVPESQCVECRPGLLPRPKDYGWCKKHGVPNCLFEHPDLAELKPLPTITQRDLDRADRAIAFAARTENNKKCKLHERRIQFNSVQAVDKLGLEVEPVWTAPMVEALVGNGEITYDQMRTARLSARVPGSVFQVCKQAGDPVRRGEVLALVDAAEVGKAKAELLRALVDYRLRNKNYEGLSQLQRDKLVSPRSIREEETALSEARFRLSAAQQSLANLGLPIQADQLKSISDEQATGLVQFLGVPQTIAKTFDPSATTANLLPVVAPFDGLLVSRETVVGEVVGSTKLLFVVVDVRQMWLTLDLRLEDATRVALGQEVEFLPDGGEVAGGKVTWISTEADHKTRTVKVRATLDNAQGRLRANTFGTGKVMLRKETDAIVVPNSAVHWEGDCHVVFVRDRNYLEKDAPKVFHVRKVRVGIKDPQNTEIIAGVLPGEIVAAKNSGVLRSELPKNDLGEG
jgi:cobalt-zinc-cadmium efflux system membrane fusion protein